MPDPRLRLEYDGPIAIITNDNPAKHNAFDDAMDLRLFEILAEIRESFIAAADPIRTDTEALRDAVVCPEDAPPL